MAPFPEKLLAGYRSFMGGNFKVQSGRYRELAETGQKPETLVIACCDSRAAPEMIFDARPGELFVLRNVANLVPPYAPDGDYHSTSAAIEFAVQSLKVRNIVVMGHGRCGGIQAALSRDAVPLSEGDFIGKWISLVEAATAAVEAEEIADPGERQTELERLSVKFSIDNLRSFPWISDRETEGDLTLHGAWFDISSGELWGLDRANGDFERFE